MLEEASSAGFDGVISTSHYMENYYEVSQADRKAWLNGLQYGLEEKKIGLSLYLGSEIYFTDKIISLIKEAKASTINGSRYVLFEFPMNAKPINIEDFVYSISFCKLRSSSCTSRKIYIYTRRAGNYISISKSRCVNAV